MGKGRREDLSDSDALARRIAQLAQQIDNHRKRVLADHPELTLTGLYNLLEKLRAGETLTAKEQVAHQHGLVSLLGEYHDHLDRAVFQAYGWPDLAERLVGRPGATTPLPDKPADQAEAEEELLMRLTDLNTRRAAEEAQGHIRWLRPEYQAADAQSPAGQTAADLAVDQPQAAPAAKQAWPKTIPDQIQAVRAILQQGPQTQAAIADHFKRKPAKAIAQILAALQVLGQASEQDGVWRV